MKALLWLMFLTPALASADVLIASCASPSATGCSVARQWVLPANVTNVQVLRGTSTPYVPLSSVLPTERIAACYDDPGITAGSTAACAARVPGRSDLWQLKSVLYPTSTPPASAPASITLTVDASNPHWDSGAAVATNLLTDLSVRLYGAQEGQTLVPIDAAPWTSMVAFKRQYADGARYCFAASLALDTTGDKVPDQESPQTAQWCGTAASPPPILTLAPPNKITGTAP